jgi:hypothetical protein
MSAAILKRRRDYYRILEASQRGTLDVTTWLMWFLGTLQVALKDSLTQIDEVLDKARFWRTHAGHGLIPAQVKVLNRLLEGGPVNFEPGISASQYQSVARVSKARMNMAFYPGCSRAPASTASSLASTRPRSAADGILASMLRAVRMLKVFGNSISGKAPNPRLRPAAR